MMRRLSIGLRLSLWYLAIFALAQLIFGAGLWWILRHSLYDLADDGLEYQLEDLKNFLHAQDSDASVAKMQEEISEAYAIEHPGDYLQIETLDQQVIYRSPFLQAHPLGKWRPIRTDRHGFSNRVMEGKPLRFISQQIEANGRAYVVVMGVGIDDVVGTLSLFRYYELMFAPLMLLIAATVGYWLSHKALAPVDRIVASARSVGGADLSSRLPKLDTGDELQRLSDTLNEMLDRIENAFLRITRFTADASHELRTPVSLIRTEAELALRRSRREEEYKESLRQILLEAERTTTLIEELLSLARADSGREALTMSTLNLSETLNAIVDGWRQIATIRNLQFSASVDGREVFVTGDTNALRRVIDILLDNAFKYTPSPGRVELCLEPSEETAVVTIKDTGLGIAAEEQSKIFERFYRVDKARSRALGGAGLGLAIAKWIVAQHSGTIAVQSKPGEGATFRVELPLTHAAVQNPTLA